jgi:hypothetical protein
MDMTQVTQETLDQMKKAFPSDGTNPLQKAMTTATDFAGYNLEPVARSLVPFDSPERNVIPRKVSPTGTIAHFKTIESIRMSGGLGRSEGERGSAITYVTAPHAFPFKSIGVQDGITREQMAASRGFESDLFAKQHTFALLRMMTEEEKLFVGGNATTALAAVGTPSLTISASAGSIGAGTYSVKCAALTLFGAEQGVNFNKQYANITLNGAAVKNSSGVVITNATNGVTSVSTGASTGAVSGSTNQIIATVTPVPGAVAYAWFVGTSGAETLQMVTTYSSATMNVLVTGGDAITNYAADGSVDAQVFDGYIPQIIAGDGYYFDAAAKTLTKSASGVAELDNLNAAIYSQYKISPNRYLCGVDAFQDITNAIVQTGGAPVLYVNNDPREKANIIGGYRTTDYVNKATGSIIPMKVHPWLPNSTIIAITDTIPYPNADIPRAIEFECGFDYLAEDYAPQKPTLEFAISAYGVLKMYAPRFCGVLTNFKPGIA